MTGYFIAGRWNDGDVHVKTCVAENSADDHHDEGCEDENKVGAKHAFTLLVTINNKWQNIWEFIQILGNKWKYIGLYGDTWEMCFETFTAPKHPKKATMETIAATTMMM